jgi:hypothetical protein
MKKEIIFLIVIVAALLFTTSCANLLSTYVRFQNNDATRTVCPIWDNIKVATLAPGQITDYKEVNSGSHTMQWLNPDNSPATSIAWPNLVAGHYYTYPWP